MLIGNQIQLVDRYSRVSSVDAKVIGEVFLTSHIEAKKGLHFMQISHIWFI